MTDGSTPTPAVLPPRGLLIALAAQLPLLAAALPLHPTPVELVLGGLLVAAGSVLNIWAERLFRANAVGVCPFSPVPTLINAGPYRWTRNPMYLGLICLDLGAALLSGVPENAWSAVAFFLWLHYAFVLPEEAFLHRELGTPFDDYARRAPRWLRRPWAVASRDTIRG